MERKKLLFLYPTSGLTPTVPGSLPILAGIAKEKGWAFRLFDTFRYDKQEADTNRNRESSGEFKYSDCFSNITRQPFSFLVSDLQAEIDDFQPNIIAITLMSVDFSFLATFFPQIALPSGTLIVGGGVHAVLCPEEMSTSGMFDLICIGEGEDVFAELLDRIEHDEQINNIAGTIYNNRHVGIVSHNHKRPLIDSQRLWRTLSDFSMFSDVHFHQPFDGRVLRKAYVECSRGCPYSCFYCGNTALKEAYGRDQNFVRVRSINSIISNMKCLIKENRVEIFSLIDECFLSKPKHWLEEFSKQYAEEIHIPFIIQTRAETVNEERIRLLKKAGSPFLQISIGVESGSERILFHVCNRKTRLESIKKAFTLLHQYHIRSCGLFMIGFPYETRQDAMQTIRLCRELCPTVSHVSIYQPFRGQKLRDVCIREGFITGNEPESTYTNHSILQMPQFTAHEIESLRRVFMLYAFLPERYFSLIERCERDWEGNQNLYHTLVALRWNPKDELLISKLEVYFNLQSF